uniref:Reverse transcriptase domain-containing protein n=1 Tax=Amphimedon queenslandica TaxID=400682 RepID=A0A1X7TY68_AMPQE
PKKDGTIRLCVDYRKLNKVSKFDAYPVPRVDEMIDCIGNGRYITTLDLNKGYWQIPIEETARDKTAFITPFGVYEFTMMPFGLQGAPATFQRLMDWVLQGTEQFAGAYIDDVAIYKHLVYLNQVLTRLRKAGLTANPKKCKFGMTEVLYLGYKIGRGQVRPEDSKTKAVMDYPRPRTKTDIQAFLACVTAPLSDLTKKKVTTFHWTTECERAFQRVKRLLCEAPVLKTPDLRKEIIVQTDASNRGVGAVLSQVGEDGRTIVSYLSAKNYYPGRKKKAPWQGGLFERMIKSTKTCLKKTVGKARLTYEDLLTSLTEVEMIVNSCPLTYLSADEIKESITLSHLLIWRRVLALPQIPQSSDEDYGSNIKSPVIVEHGNCKYEKRNIIEAANFSLLASLVSPDKPIDRSLGDLLATLRNHISQQRVTIAERFRFHNQSQKEEESVAEFAAELRRLTAY